MQYSNDGFQELCLLSADEEQSILEHDAYTNDDFFHVILACMELDPNLNQSHDDIFENKLMVRGSD